MSSKAVKITLSDWDYTCGDGCCSEYGTSISFNGEECDNHHAGGDPKQAIEFILDKLGIEYEIEYVYD